MARLRRGASPTTARLSGAVLGPTLTTVNDVSAGISLFSPWLRASFQVFDWQSVNRYTVGLTRRGASGPNTCKSAAKRLARAEVGCCASIFASMPLVSVLYRLKT